VPVAEEDAALERLDVAELLLPENSQARRAMAALRRGSCRRGSSTLLRSAGACETLRHARPSRFRHRRPRLGTRRGGSASRVRRKHPASGTRARALAQRGDRERVPSARRGDAAQPRDHADAARRSRADAAFAARQLRHTGGQPSLASLADPSAALAGALPQHATRSSRAGRRMPRPGERLPAARARLRRRANRGEDRARIRAAAGSRRVARHSRAATIDP
jgi:hypothetical protein